MLKQLSIRNFQSHKNTKLDLSRFTVIVGASSSGKSSVVRALKLLARNGRGTSYVRNGQGSSKISALGESGFLVTIERGAGKSVYELLLPDSEETQIFTKCGTSTPDAVSSALDFGADDTWLASQFDRPFLLDETGSQIARVLGDLTNVSMIFAAVRECNRRHSSARSRYVSKLSELDQVRTSLQKYMDLPQRLAACAAAEDVLLRAQDVSTRCSTLDAGISAALSAQGRLRAAQVAVVAVPDEGRLLTISIDRLRLHSLLTQLEEAQDKARSVVVPGILSDEKLQTLSKCHAGLLSRIREVEDSSFRLLEAKRSSESVSQQVNASRARLGNLLSEGGSCPVCGAAAEHARVDHILM